MGQRGKTNGAPGSHALLGAKHLEVIGDFIFLRLIVNLHHEIGEAVDDGDGVDGDVDDGDDDDFYVEEIKPPS